jgi:hypothetical protein
VTFPGREAAVEFRKRSAPRHRFGLKGPRAAEWLAARGIQVPTAPNTWISVKTADSGSGANTADSAVAVAGVSGSLGAAAHGDGVLVARLGTGEFFLEDGVDGTTLRDIDPGVTAYQAGGSLRGDGAYEAWPSSDGPSGGSLRGDGAYEAWPSSDGPSGDLPSGVYPVLRSDAAFLLSGAGSFDVLAQVCNVNFAELPLASNPVVMTLMIGVSVLVVPRVLDGERQVLIWCDPTFGEYLEESLERVVSESGGQVKREGSI